MKGESTFSKLSDDELERMIAMTRTRWAEAWDAARDPFLSQTERERWRKKARNLGHSKGRLHQEQKRRQKAQQEVKPL